MLFGVRLSKEIYEPWKNEYIAYEKLKKLLKENVIGESGQEEESWTDKDETRFVSLLDQELEKVYSFETKKFNELSNRIAKLEERIDSKEIANVTNPAELQREMESILEYTTELDKFRRLNYTGFVKVVKKHDRLHQKYQVKPLLQVRLNSLPFHSEDYSPLLYRLSALYSFLGENFGQNIANSASAMISSFTENSGFTTLRFWVHPENLVEVKTKILRHLPVLIYDREGEDEEDGMQSGDPTISSLYFDNSSFELYHSQLVKKRNDDVVTSLRLRWYEKLIYKPDIILEQKAAGRSPRITLKDKNIKPFISGDKSVITKAVEKMKSKRISQVEIDSYEKAATELQDFIVEHKVSPVMRSIYKRTAFEIPGDDRLRIILDSDVLFVREDSFNKERPARDPNDWHRKELDLPDVNPLTLLRSSEYSRFPYCILEAKIKVSENAPTPAWVQELASSNLVKEVPVFSKFLQGVSSLFAEDDRLDSLPFWLNDLDYDIRESAVDHASSSGGTSGSRNRRASSITASRLISKNGFERDSDEDSSDDGNDDEDGDVQENENGEGASNGTSVRSPHSIGYPVWVNHSHNVDANKLDWDSEDEEVILPPGVSKPTVALKNMGAVKVETKVWLANERTFNKWLHITVLLSVLTFTLYNSVKHAFNPHYATLVAYILFALSLFSGLWGYSIYMVRLKHIKERGDYHFDNSFGPIVVAIGLLFALIINFGAAFYHRSKNDRGINV